MPEMKKDIKKLWVKALRSGQYKQGTDCLRTGEKFCCLGVLCDLHAKATGDFWKNKNVYYEETGVLPIPVMRWAGLNNKNPYIGDYALSQYNDGEDCKKQSFKKIAALIQRHL